MSHADFLAPLNSKVQGSWNLHTLLPPTLEFFVMLSSIAGIFGSGGQSNYAAGSTFQDSLAEYRVSRGLKATSIDLGPVRLEGYLAQAPDIINRLETTDGLQTMQPETLHALLEHYCKLGATGQHHQVLTGLGTQSNLQRKGGGEIWWMKQPLFRALQQVPGDQDVTAGRSGHPEAPPSQRHANLAETFQTVRDAKELREIVIEVLMSRLERIMPGSFADDEVGAKLREPLHNLGVDSLVAVELRNWVAKDMKAGVATFDILGGMGLEDLADLVVTRSSLRAPEVGKSKVL